RDDPVRGIGPVRRFVHGPHSLHAARLSQRSAVRTTAVGHHGDAAVVVAVPGAGAVSMGRQRTIATVLLAGLAIALPARADDPAPATPPDAPAPDPSPTSPAPATSPGASAPVSPTPPSAPPSNPGNPGNPVTSPSSPSSAPPVTKSANDDDGEPRLSLPTQ